MVEKIIKIIMSAAQVQWTWSAD